jgi:hypothetical protein
MFITVLTGPPLALILSRMNPIRNLIISPTSVLILSLQLRIRIQSVHFHSDSLPKFCMHFSHVPYLLHALPIPITLIFIILIISGEEQKL